MISKRIVKAMFSNAKNQQLIPKPPKFLSGELQPFRYDFQNAQLYDGYTLDQLYGAKVGYKHPPAVRAQMVKDSLAASLILVVGFGLTLHLNNIHKKQMQCLDKVQQSKLTKQVQLPPAIYKNPGLK